MLIMKVKVKANTNFERHNNICLRIKEKMMITTHVITKDNKKRNANNESHLNNVTMN